MFWPRTEPRQPLAMRRVRSLSFSSLFLLLGLLVSVPGARALDEPWQEAALLLYNSASPELNRLRAMGSGSARLADYAEALILLHQSPPGSEGVEEARTILQQLASARRDDDISAAADYYLVRILQIHQKDPDPEAARERFKELYLARPKHFFGQMALLKYVFAELYNEQSSLPIAERIAYLQDLAEGIEIPATKRWLHRILGEAYLNHGLSKEKAFQHLKVAYEVGYPMATAQIDAGLDLAELAEELGRVDYAVEICDEMLATYGYDPRKEEIEAARERLAAKQ